LNLREGSVIFKKSILIMMSNSNVISGERFEASMIEKTVGGREGGRGCCPVVTARMEQARTTVRLGT
jgi:hypothetical protein